MQVSSYQPWKVALSIDCLLVIENDSPLNFALEMLFGSSSGINAVKSRANNFQELVDEVCDLNSQVVLLEDSARLNGRNSPAQLLMSNPGLKIIVVLRESNYIHIFRKEEIMIQSSSDLIEAIQSN